MLTASRWMTPFQCVLIAIFLHIALVGADAPSRYNIDTGFKEWDVGLGGLDAHVAAFGDFDGDKKTDVILVDQNRNEVSIYTWNSRKC